MPCLCSRSHGQIVPNHHHQHPMHFNFPPPQSSSSDLQFGRHKYLSSRYSTFFDRLPNLLFISVGGSSINVSVATFQRLHDSFFHPAVVAITLKCSKSDGGNRISIHNENFRKLFGIWHCGWISYRVEVNDARAQRDWRGRGFYLCFMCEGHAYAHGSVISIMTCEFQHFSLQYKSSSRTCIGLSSVANNKCTL